MKRYSNFEAFFLPFFLLWLASVVIYFYQSIILSYLEIPISSVSLFIVQDGWCDKSFGDGLGAHCWGDFALPFYGSQDLLNGEIVNPVVLHNTPLFLALISLLGPLGFNPGLAVALPILVSLALVPSVFLALQFETKFRLFVFVLSGLVSLPVLLTFDRANHAASVIGAFAIVFLLLNLIERRRELERFLGPLVVIFGSIVFGLKFWSPLILLIPFLMQKPKYTLAILFGGSSLTLVSVLRFSTDVVGLGRDWIGAIFSPENAIFLGPHSISVPGLFSRLVCVASAPDLSCNFTEFATLSGLAPQSRIISAALTFAFIVLLMAGFYRIQRPLASLAIAFLIPPVVLPDAGAYNSVGFVAALALILMNESRPTNLGFKRSELSFLTMCSLIPTLVIPLGFFRQDGLQLLPWLDMWRFQNLASPIVSIALLVVLFIVLRRNYAVREAQVVQQVKDAGSA